MSFQSLADKAAKWAGSRWTFLAAILLVLGWSALGPIFNYSDSWSLFINTVTTIITFLMVFLIQNSANRTAMAQTALLSELILVTDKARNELVGLEKKTETEIEAAVTEIQEKA